MAKEILNEGHWHEATDRIDCIINIIDNMLLKHQAVRYTPELRQLVKDAQDKLGEAYQLAGAKM